MESSQVLVPQDDGNVESTKNTTTTASTTTTTITTKSAGPTTSKYVRDFESLFVPIKVEELRNKAQNGNLRHCQFRSLCWRYFLKCLPERYEDWLVACRDSRQSYETIRAKHLKSIKPNYTNHQEQGENVTKEGNHPSENSTKTEPVSLPSSDQHGDNQISRGNDESGSSIKECDYKNVFRTIERDVVRTFPDMEFFKQTEMQNILENVLFNYASENPHISYKQGMHELLATLLYVVHTDSQNCLINYEGDYANETIATLLDLEHLEHDVFHLFCALMKSLETWYQNDEILVVADNPVDNISINRSFAASKQQVNSVLGIKLKRISENILKKFDYELFNHLEALQIAPQIYGIRWMRLLFGREFEFLDLLTVWDAIICDQNPMTLIDYVFSSMLITIREDLVNGDYTDCLNNLMRHQFKDVSYVIKLALYLRDPSKNSRPRLLGSSSKLVNQKQLSASSLTSKLSQQYISDKQYSNSIYPRTRGSQDLGHGNSMTTRRHQPRTHPNNQHQSGIDTRDSSRKVSGMTSQSLSSQSRPQQQRFPFNTNDPITTVASDGIKFLARTSLNTAAMASSKGKFLPHINKFVSSIGQNIQDKSSGHPHQQAASTSSPRGNRRLGSTTTTQKMQGSSSSSSHGTGDNQQYHHRSSDLILSAGNTVREYEMREMQSTSSSSSTSAKARENRFPLGKITGGGGGGGGNSSGSPPGNAFNISTESYDDLHSIVDYCWRLLSEQIDSLQRCLPKEKCLSSEDEIFVALAQLKKVRDVLKGSLRLEDELESGSSKY